MNVFSGRRENSFTETLSAFVVTFLSHASKEAFQWIFHKCDILEEFGVLVIKKLTSRTQNYLNVRETTRNLKKIIALAFKILPSMSLN